MGLGGAKRRVLGTGHALFLNLDAECMDVFIFKNSLSCTFKIYILYHTYIIHYTIKVKKGKISPSLWNI